MVRLAFLTENRTPHILNPTSEAQERNDRALAVLNRVQHKLTGL